MAEAAEIQNGSVFTRLGSVPRPNNFDLLRLFAATQVVFDHSDMHLHTSDISPIFAAFNWFIDMFPGVPIFFVMSGFLISASLARNPHDIRQYFRNRALRLLPGLVAVFLLAVILMTVQGVITPSSLTAPSFYAWIVAQLTIGQAYSPAMFDNYGIGHTNGALWTVAVEIQFYFLTPLVLLRILKKPNDKASYLPMIALFLVSLAAFVYVMPRVDLPEVSKVIRYTYLGTFLPHFWLFLVGMALYRWWPKVERFFVGKGLYYLGAYIVLAVAWKQFNVPGFWFFERAALAPTAIALAFTLPSLSEKLLKGADISYGIYIYHLVLMNVFVQQKWPVTMTTWSLFMVNVFAVAALSWFLIEKPFLSKKQRKTPPPAV
jgi:peptidoglycan/LPS O-acetylase OafA/YrhL